MKKYLYVEFLASYGETTHIHRDIVETTAKDLEFVANRHVAEFFGYSCRVKAAVGKRSVPVSKVWAVDRSDMTLSLRKYRELSRGEYMLLYDLFYIMYCP